MFGGLNVSVRTEAFEKSSYLPMRSSASFKAKRTQLRPFKEERRKTISSFYDGERRRRPGAIKNEQKRRPKEATNYALLCRLLVDVGSQVLRKTFDKIYRPEDLGTLLSRKATHSLLLKLRKKQVLNAHQWEKLYPQSLVSSQNFDTPLLTVLLKNICGLVPPAHCWDRPPPTENITPEADIIRITLYRDRVYSYAEGGTVDDETFNLYWKDITDVLVRLGGACYQNAIDRIKTECMTSDFEKYYRELLNNWHQDDDTIEEREDRAVEGKFDQFGRKLNVLTDTVSYTPFFLFFYYESLISEAEA